MREAASITGSLRALLITGAPLYNLTANSSDAKRQKLVDGKMKNPLPVFYFCPAVCVAFG